MDMELISCQLERILASAEFEASERNRKFLQFIVAETLAGRQDRLKAYTIATAVMNRPDDFDPQSDPVVRIEAGKLRRALERYYLGAGRADPLVIAIPKGSYAPQFQPRAAGAPATPRPRLGRAALGLLALSGAGLALLPAADLPAPGSAAPAVLVLPFAAAPGASADLARGLTEEVLGGLTRHKGLAVFATAPGMDPAAPPARRQAAELGADFILSGRVEVAGPDLRLQAALIAAADGRYLWTASLRQPLASLPAFELQGRLAARVAEALAEPGGALFAGADWPPADPEANRQLAQAAPK